MFNIQENDINGQTNRLLYDILEELKKLNKTDIKSENKAVNTDVNKLPGRSKTASKSRNS